MEEVGRRWANACRYKGESKSKDYVEEWDENRLWCEGLLSCSDQSRGLQSSKEEEITWDIKAEESPAATYTSYILQSSSQVRTTI